MVFHCRCFSFLFEEEIEYETRTETKSTSTETGIGTGTGTGTFYTACSDLNLPVPIISSHFSNLAGKPSHLRVFSIAELKTATKNFCKASSWIGEGGFGNVYRGVIKSLDHPFDDIQIAVKYAKGVLQRHNEWLTEVNVLSVVEHPNLVKLVGYCAEDDEKRIHRLLVYEYMPNKSVRDHLSSRSKASLSWTMRLKVAHDTARALAFLHEEMSFQIIFGDFKSSNILLDDQWNAKLSDFGVARFGPREGLTRISTKFVGTMGYAAPEYLAMGHLTSKSDVWSYGVFLYELITGRHPLDTNRPQNEQKLLEWVKPYVDSKNLHLIIDSRIKDMCSLKSAQKFLFIANCCLSEDPKLRPNMSVVLKMVNQLVVVPSQLAAPLKNLVPMIGARWKKVVMGKKTYKDPKNKGEEGSADIQLNESAHRPRKRFVKINSCFRNEF